MRKTIGKEDDDYQTVNSFETEEDLKPTKDDKVEHRGQTMTIQPRTILSIAVIWKWHIPYFWRAQIRKIHSDKISL
jgi:hypothetical protein